MPDPMIIPTILERFLHPATDWNRAQEEICATTLDIIDRATARAWIARWRTEYASLSMEIRRTKHVLHQSHTPTVYLDQRALRGQRRRARLMLALRAQQKAQSRRAILTGATAL